jgi:RimJ/RimL family protein N-acetyltransferase/nitrite reductase/ring-hydroxylating ferredoxin subunit
MTVKVEPPNPPLTDGAVTLRPLRAGDEAAIDAACQDPEIRRWVPMIPVPYTVEDARRFILFALRAWQDGTGHQFAIADAATDRYIGSIGVQGGERPGRFSIGYLVAPAERGRGIATRALRLATRWAFATLPVQRLALWTLPGNSASQRVAEKAGFRYEGVIRNWSTDRDGRPADAVMFSMSRDDLAEADADVSPDLLAAVPRELRAAGTRAAPFVEIAALSDLGPGSMRRVTVAGLDLLVARTDRGIVVTDDRCPHMSAPLSIGELDGCVVACPLHEGRFDLVTGETVRMPTTGGLDAEGLYHAAWSPSGSASRPEPTTKKLEARRLTRVHRLRYYPARVRDGRLEAQVPIAPE